MKGYIKIESVEHDGKLGISADTEMTDVSYFDRIMIVRAVCRGLHISPSELKTMAALLDCGLLDAMTETEVLEDKLKSEPVTKSVDPVDTIFDLIREILK